MSRIWKGINRSFIKVLNFSYNNEWFKIVIFITVIFYTILLFWFRNSNLINISSLGYAIVTSMYIAGWSYHTYKADNRIKKLEYQLNKDSNIVSKEYIRENLADLMHQIWSDEILSEKYPTDSELKRAEQIYFSLSKEDKEVNRAKADRVINLFEEYNVF